MSFKVQVVEESIHKQHRTRHVASTYSIKLTVLRSRSVMGASSPFFTATSIVGNAPFSSLRTLGWSLMSIFRAKLSVAKCIEQSTEVFVGLKPGRCFCTKFVHFLRVTLFEGKRCIDTPGVWLELVQLSNPGPPATQYFPDTRRFRTSAISLNNLHNWWRHKEFFGRAGNVADFSLKCWTLSFGKNIL